MEVITMYPNPIPTPNPDCRKTLQEQARPFVSSIYTADPAASVGLDGRLYIYPSHDMDPARGCDCMDRYHIYSTEDMKHFRDEGEILRSDDLPWGRPEGGFMWAPDCRAAKDGKYYFYYPHPDGSRWNDTWKIGVCVSDRPGTGYRDLGFIEGIGGFCMIDPSIFLDTDGTPYLYYGGGGMSRAVILEEDMKTVKGGKVYEIEGLEDFHEAPYLFLRNGIYYLTYSDNVPGRNRMHYATASTPLGPFVHRGVYLEATGSDTSHGSVVEYKGHWYCFYHICAISGRGNLRSICVDELFFEPDGSIRTVIQKGMPYESDPFDYSVLRALRPSDALRDPHFPDLSGSGSAVLAGERRLIFTKVDGGDEGRVSLHFGYRTDALCHIQLIVNETDWSFVNLSPDRERTSFTVPLRSGKRNRLEIRFCDGGGELTEIRLEPLDG